MRSMKVIFCHSTALDLIRSCRCGAPFQLLQTRSVSISDSVHTRTGLAKVELPSFPHTDKRIHVLVPTPTMLCDSSIHKSHLIMSPLPVGSLLKISDEVFTVSPSLLFLQLGKQLSWLDLALIGAELCGQYSLLPANSPGMRRCAPITQNAALAAYIKKFPHARGIRTAARALDCISDLSASPLESSLFLLLTLPVKWGGYGLPKPSMNPSSPLSKRTARVMGVDELHCDLRWHDPHVALEYNSKDHHVGHLTHDARRTNALTAEGERVYTMTPAILANPIECDNLVKLIAHNLGHRLRGNALGDSPKRSELREKLFPWASGEAGFANFNSQRNRW